MTCELTEVVTLVFAWMMNQRWNLGLESSRAIVRDPCPSRKLYPVGFALGYWRAIHHDILHFRARVLATPAA
mgnify:CR=1 FL=1